MELKLELTEELGAELERMAKEKLVSVEDIAMMALSSYVSYFLKERKKFDFASFLTAFGHTLIQAGTTFQQAKKKEE